MFIKKIVQGVANFLFPIICSSCGNLMPSDDKYRLCENCFRSLKFISDGLYCVRCGRFLPSGGAHCRSCRSEKFHFEFIRSAVLYEGVARDLIHKFKYRGAEYLKHLFGKILAEEAKKHEEIANCDFLLPVPLHRLKKILRGYNQSELIASVLAKNLGKSFLKDVLIKTRYTRQQAKLKKSERRKNVLDAFRVVKDDAIRGKNLLLIDDVATTGATIECCAAILRRAGSGKVYCLTVARD